ncbi:hypothetical protein BB560_001313 [Smittium megazygosporum]|uniref:Trafficking protein particle complex subunit BET3 n=1 Tax=Smittium megazygosporum TaxID=133381 RepID=A0A2T9ZHX8_9FUNG|nr:hypothetical protein BB560_001313 [Smittium megazygosporum]
MSKNYKAIGEDIFKNKVEKISLEFFIFTYGSMVIQLIKDYDDYTMVNTTLEKLGYNMGIRLVDDFLSITQFKPCTDFKNVMEILTKVGFKVYLNIVPQLDFQSEIQCTLTLTDNPLAENVELPPDAIENGLWYSNWMTGVIRGALEQIQFIVTTEFTRDVLRGDDTTEIVVTLIKIADENVLAPED